MPIIMSVGNALEEDIAHFEEAGAGKNIFD